jgi:hypothetical protein
MKKFVGVLCCAVVLCAEAISACDLCSVYRALETRESRPGWYAGVFEQFSRFTTLRDDGERVPNQANQFLDSSITQLVLGHQFNRQLGAQLNVPVIYRSFRRPHDDKIERDTEAGPGDVTLLAHARVFEHHGEKTTMLASALLGVKFPTGNSRRLREELEEDHHDVDHGPQSGVHGHDLALGSGSYDVVLGAETFARWKRFFAAAAVQYAARTKGDFDYKFANELTGRAGPGVYVLLGHEAALGLQCLVAGEWKPKDQLNGKPVRDTGITAVYLGPALTASRGRHLSTDVAVEFPVLQETTDLQIVPDYRVRAAVLWRF